MKRPIITLCTDFGVHDGYVAALKGVILEIAPEARIVDVSHGIPPQDIACGAFILASAAPYFPSGTIHIVVIDPGVGSQREGIAVEVDGATFVAPDNGVLDLATREHPVRAAAFLRNTAYWRTNEPSATFHGRDIFAPVGAHLAMGIPLAALGPPAQGIVSLQLAGLEERSDGSITGSVLHVDRFGNLITNIPADALPTGAQWTASVGDSQPIASALTYASVTPGALLTLEGSHGYIEIAAREASASQRLGARRGDLVRLCPLL